MLPPDAPLPDRARHLRDRFAALETEVGKVVVGQPEVVRGVLTALFVGGHVLLEGVPGLGKTLLVRTLAQALDLSFNRVQFTPDLMPSDITGTTVLDEQESRLSAMPMSRAFSSGWSRSWLFAARTGPTCPVRPSWRRLMDSRW